ncbi:acyl-CoA dehydrogenase family protein [Dactylosporangium sp. NPDC051485]|uniref:acyl-CoA dehydrogenase family protein n=1 Tax=Dactylosporangium sp. NPDC051485 TaxID=3154846 RepID=UPI00342AADAF
MTSTPAEFRPVELTDAEKEVVRAVRGFARERAFPPSAASPTRGGFDRDFSRELGARGWAGMLVPARYGGSESSGVERCLVISELLSAGAPLGAHWTADRQTAPSLDKYGPEPLRQELLPKIARGDLLMAGGFSEPDAGSDLASVKTRAVKVEGGWRVTGRKIWTSDADRADYIEILCRTSEGEKKHEGLSLIVVPMDAPGIQVHPIVAMDGERHFNEVVIEDVFAPDDWLLGEEGKGWNQITAELALERSGPERYLSTYPLFEAFVESRRDEPESEQAFQLIGRVIAQQIALRQMSLSIARMVDAGVSPVAEAAMAKDLGTELEQLLVDQLWPYRYESERRLAPGDRLARFLDINRLRSAVFTTAGGTNEVLRIIVARELVSWGQGRRRWVERPGGLVDGVLDVIDSVRSDTLALPAKDEPDPLSLAATDALRKGGFLGVSVAEAAGGSGGTLSDALDAARAIGYSGVSVPLVEGPIQAGWLLAEAGVEFAWESGLAVFGGASDQLSIVDGAVQGSVHGVVWAPVADELVFAVADGSGTQVIAVDRSAAVLRDVTVNSAGEPVAGTVVLDGAPVKRSGRLAASAAAVHAQLRHRAALARAIAIAGALQAAAELTITYANQRRQFGKPIAAFQAVQTHLTRIASEAQRTSMLTDWAQAAVREGEPLPMETVAAAKTLSGYAADWIGRTAHQVHGAMGVTMEYPLHRFTRRMWEWSLLDGPTHDWAAQLGRAAAASEGAAWRIVTTVA